MSESRTYIGVDIGGTKIACGLVDETGKLLFSEEVHTDAHRGGASVLRVAINLALSIAAMAETGSIQAIGIGAGGQIDAERGIVVSATYILPGWNGTQIKREFEDAFKVPAFVDNDVNALAMGELRFGVAKNLKTVVFLALGTGVGGAIVIDGKIHHGAHWTGGELGHLILSMDPNARQDVGGARGTLESFCSGPGLVRTWRELTSDYSTQITGAQISENAKRAPHGPASAAISKTGEYLGYGLASMANVLDPDLFIIGGGLAQLGEMLLAPARETLHRLALPGPAKCKVVTATLGENASLIGAASLAITQ